MSKIIDAEDILGEARNFVECVWMAASILANEDRDPLMVVADAASKKIEEAIALLDEYCKAVGAAAPPAKPKSPAARTKRKGK